MKLETFKALIKGIQDYSEKKDKAYKLGIDTFGFDDDYYGSVVKPLMVEAFGEEGFGWIEWFLYERVSFSGEFLKAHDKEGKEICYDV